MQPLDNALIQDAIKAVVYALPLVSLILIRKKLQLKYFLLLFSGVLLLFLGHLLDLLDEFSFFTDLPLEDFFEDTLGFTLGYALILLAGFLELRYHKKV